VAAAPSGGGDAPEVESLRCDNPAGPSGGGSRPQVAVQVRHHSSRTATSSEPDAEVGARSANVLRLPPSGSFPPVEILRGTARGPTTRSTRSRYSLIACQKSFSCKTRIRLTSEMYQMSSHSPYLFENCIHQATSTTEMSLYAPPSILNSTRIILLS